MQSPPHLRQKDGKRQCLGNFIASRMPTMGQKEAQACRLQEGTAQKGKTGMCHLTCMQASSNQLPVESVSQTAAKGTKTREPQPSHGPRGYWVGAQGFHAVNPKPPSHCVQNNGSKKTATGSYTKLPH